MRYLNTRVLSLVVALLFVVMANGQVNTVDPTFNAVPSSPLTSPSSLAQVVQPDGKVIVYGPRLVADGIAKSDILRLNADGTLDTTFSYCGCGLSFIRNLMLAPGGKVIVAGGSPDDNSGRMIRLNSDGSIDPTFLATVPGPPPFFGGAEFLVNAVQPDGKVIATSRVSQTGFSSYTLVRRNADGTADSGFPSIGLASGSPMSAFAVVRLLPDGRFYLAVTSGVTGTGSTLTRRNSDGSSDSSWETPSFQTSGFPSATSIADLAVAADGSVLVSGAWDTVNGASRKNLIRLQAAGNVDLAFISPTAVQVGGGVDILPDGKILHSGRTDISGINRIFRLNSDGSADNTFTLDPAVTSILNGWKVDSNGRIIFLANAGSVRLVRLQTNGGLDASFNPDLGYFGTVNALARQSDGKVLVAGVYSRMNGIGRNGLARVNGDGTLDPTFDAGSGFSGPPTSMILQSDGKILAVGDFGTYNGTTVNGLVRINTDGSIDNTFVVTVSSNPSSVALQADGKILISGSFASVNGTTRTGVARLNTNGSLDDTFNPTIGSPNIFAVVAQADGKIMIAGSFSGVNGFNRSNLARLNSDGSLDQSFTANSLGGPVSRLLVQSDGKYLIGVGSPATTLARRNSDGIVDGTFTPPTFLASSSSDTAIHSIVIQPDGSYIVGGRFDTVAGVARRNIARLAPNGTFDMLFINSGANGRVRALAADTVGKVLVGGDFTTIANTVRAGVARLTTAPYREITPFDFDGDGRADFSVYRPSTAVWYELSSASSSYVATTFGLPTDIATPADFDGDGKTDEAIFRPSTGDWWYQSSINNAQLARRYGVAGDVPRPGDFDGDGKADFIVFRPSNNTWYRAGTSIGEVAPYPFGVAGDIPVVGDFDGDGKVDPAVFRPSTGDWWYAATSKGLAHRQQHWGANGDIPAPADFDGDRITDLAVFRPSEGGWYVYRSSDDRYITMTFGTLGDRPIPADYDGDGEADIAVFRPSTGIWYLNQSTSGIGGVQWGLATDVVVPNAFLP